MQGDPYRSYERTAPPSNLWRLATISSVSFVCCTANGVGLYWLCAVTFAPQRGFEQSMKFVELAKGAGFVALLFWVATEYFWSSHVGMAAWRRASAIGAIGGLIVVLIVSRLMVP